MKLQPGRVYGMSNGNFGDWEKVKLGQDLVKESLDNFEEIIEIAKEEQYDDVNEELKLGEDHLKLELFGRY